MIDQRFQEIVVGYYKIFEEMWGINQEKALMLGAAGDVLWEAEVLEYGLDAYRTSVVLPIRNAYWRCSSLPILCNYLRQFPIEEPILDYGCGVGTVSAWLANEQGYDTYAYELPGIQRKVLKAAGDRFGFTVLDDPTQIKPKTVLCINVLEHIEHPLPLVQSWFDNGAKYVYANFAYSDQADHIGSHEEGRVIEKMLRERGTWVNPQNDDPRFSP